jgi:hypothetical protein
MKVYVEATDKKAFACAVDWPGWCRSGKNEAAALENLLEYQDRYAAVLAGTGLDFHPDEPRVVERVVGNATTTFGAPDVVPKLDKHVPVPPGHIAILKASWQLLADVAATAPQELRKGPRGGGRDRDDVVQHVVSAEAAWARKLGVQHKTPSITDPAAVRAMRDAVVAVLAGGATGETWPAPYFLRRATWHVLDHVWEIEDKSAPA